MAGIAATGQDMPPMPARRGAWAIYEVFATADGGELFIGVTSDQQWRRFAPAVGLEALVDDPRLATNGMRVVEQSWLIPAVAAAIARLPTASIAEACLQAQVSWAPVGRPGDMFTDPHLLASGGLLETIVPGLGGVAASLVGLPALPLEFGDERARSRLQRQPPGLGADSQTVLEQGGFGAAEIAALVARGVVTES
jgi:crotonobetainyl-CoA:carnitine CoA-transferase CaiB-like acyl-CoA transferase